MFQVRIRLVAMKLARSQEERAYLQELPKRRTQDYAEHRVLISSSSTFDLRRVIYTVPSRFIGERLYVQLYDERLELFHGHEKILELPRVYGTKTQRGRCVDYRHVIDSLVRKPQAFRHSPLRDDLLPSPDYHRIWQHVDDTLPSELQCRQRFGVEATVIPLITSKQHNLSDYDQLLEQEVQHG